MLREELVPSASTAYRVKALQWKYLTFLQGALGRCCSRRLS